MAFYFGGCLLRYNTFNVMNFKLKMHIIQCEAGFRYFSSLLLDNTSCFDCEQQQEISTVLCTSLKQSHFQHSSFFIHPAVYFAFLGIRCNRFILSFSITYSFFPRAYDNLHFKGIFFETFVVKLAKKKRFVRFL